MATNRPVGLSILALLFLIWGLRALGGITVGPGVLAKFPGLALALLTLATAYGLFRMQRWTLPIYAVWVGIVIAVGGATEYTSGTPIAAVVAWMALMVAVYLAVGLFIRSSLAAPAN